MIELIGPRHVAMIMDGHRRWADTHSLENAAGYAIGCQQMCDIAVTCTKKKINWLTSFVFPPHRENFVAEETQFFSKLHSNIALFNENNIQVKIIGNRDFLSGAMRKYIAEVENLTVNNTALQLTIAAYYSAQAEMTDIMRQIGIDIEQGKLTSEAVTPELIQTKLTLAHLPDPDFFIQTGGSRMLNDFLLWQFAYTELYFSNTLWPDFSVQELEQTLDLYRQRERRFGYISEQLRVEDNA